MIFIKKTATYSRSLFLNPSPIPTASVRPTYDRVQNMGSLWSADTRLKHFAFLGLFALAVTTFLGKPDATSLQALDSTTHAVISLEASKGGLLPNLPMQDPGIDPNRISRFNDHPFPLFFIVGKTMRLLGPSSFSARLIPALFSTGCVLLLAWLGALLFNPAAGLISGLILILSRDFLLIGSRFHLDTPMIFFILLSFVLWTKNMPLGAGIASGFGLWMKTPVAFLLYPSMLLALILSGELERKKILNLIQSGLIALAVGSSVWILTGMIGGWDLPLDYWNRQVWGTAVGGRGGGGPIDFGMGIDRLKSTYIPWNLALLFSLFMIFLKKRWKVSSIAIPLAAALVMEGVISAMRFKFFWYYLPIYPFLALICVVPIREFLETRKQTIYSGFVGLGIIIPLILLCSPIQLGPENFPALRKFSPMIQSYGSASDQVLFIHGKQPYGGHLDSVYELTFYTGRKVLQGFCESAESQIAVEKPEWIVVSGENFNHCLKPETRALYPVQYRFGTQHLLSRIIPAGSNQDLTPLRLELKPPLDGASEPTSDDPYFPRN